MSEQTRPASPRIDRRGFLKVGGAVGAAAATGGLQAILAARRAPAHAQGRQIHLLQWVDFIPEGDAELRRQAAEYTAHTKVEVRIESINANDLQARITAAIQSGTGPDIILMMHNWPHLYASALADVSDLCEWKAKDQGGYYAVSEAAARAGKRWLAHFPIPAGPLGPTPSYNVAFSHALMKYSRNQRAAKEFLRWLHAKEQFGKWFEIETGYSIGATTYWERHPMWDKVDAALQPFRVAVRNSRMIGYAGTPTAKASEALTKYVITDMYAKAVQGMPPAEAVRWAEAELKKIYEG